MIIKIMSLTSLVFFLAGCQRGARQVTFENPCADAKANTSKNCNKPNTQTGGTGSGDDSWGNDDASTSTPGETRPPSNGGGGTTPIPSGGGGTKPPTPGGGGGGSPIPSGGGGSPIPSGGDGTKPPVPGGGGVPLPSNPGSDFTNTVKLGILVTKQGVPTLIFNGGNQSKFASMQYAAEAFSMVAPDSSLLMQGQGNSVGQFGLKTSLTFKYDGKSCMGNAVAKFEVETPVAVKCQ